MRTPKLVEAAEDLAASLASAKESTSTRGPKGTRIGDVVTAEGSRWRVEAIDAGRREAVCRLIGGSGVLRRFRARRILRVERTRRTLS